MPAAVGLRKPIRDRGGAGLPAGPAVLPECAGTGSPQVAAAPNTVAANYRFKTRSDDRRNIVDPRLGQPGNLAMIGSAQDSGIGGVLDRIVNARTGKRDHGVVRGSRGSGTSLNLWT